MTTLRLASLPPNTMLASATSVASEDVPESVRLLAGVSGSPMVKAIAAVGIFSSVLWGPIALMVGGSFTALTVNTNVTEASRAPSLTVTVMSVVPDWPNDGVRTTLRLAPFPPPKAMFAFGTRVVFEEVPVTVNPTG